MNLTRHQIVNGSYVYPDDLITLKETNHFKTRFEERTFGLAMMPTRVRITKDNVHSGKTRDGTTLNSVVIRLKYSSKWMFLCFDPYDGVVKSIWFKDIKYGGQSKGEDYRQAV